MQKFKPNQIIERFKTKNGKEVVLRTPSMKDLNQLLHFINFLADEDTFILVVKRKTRKGEKEWLKNALKDLKEGKEMHVVAEIDNKIVGNSSIKIESERSLHVGELALSVLKEYRNLGIGKKMMETLIELGKKMGFRLLLLGVFENNKIAIKMYRKFGFRKIARIPKILLYKGKYFDDVWMMKKL